MYECEGVGVSLCEYVMPIWMKKFVSDCVCVCVCVFVCGCVCVFFDFEFRLRTCELKAPQRFLMKN